MKLTKEQAKHLHKVLTYYGWKKGRELAGADLVNQQQVYAKVQDELSRHQAGLQDPETVAFPTYKPATSKEEA